MKILFITSVPSFYKNLLFNEIAKKASLNIHFTNRSNISRSGDFFKYLDKGLLMKDRGFFSSFLELLKESRSADYIYYGGWDDILYWALIFWVPKSKNRMILESSIFENKKKSISSGMLNYLKFLFLNKISLVIASGTPHICLLKELRFGGKIIMSNGVGLLDFKYPPLKIKLKSTINNFLFIGRISYLKGIDILIDFFSKNPNLKLHLVGTEQDYKINGQHENIKFYGYKSRHELKDIFSICDVFILPSRVETWGLVVEEALYHGVPVVVSNVVGCNIDIVKNYNVGEIFDINSTLDFKQKIDSIREPEAYNIYANNISSIDFEVRKKAYINSFLCE